MKAFDESRAPVQAARRKKLFRGAFALLLISTGAYANEPWSCSEAEVDMPASAGGGFTFFRVCYLGVDPFTLMDRYRLDECQDFPVTGPEQCPPVGEIEYEGVDSGNGNDLFGDSWWLNFGFDARFGIGGGDVGVGGIIADP